MIHVNAASLGPGQSDEMLESIHWVGALCTSDVALRGGLLVGLFVAGAAGSVVHCGPMCGAFVLGQVSERLARLPPERLCEWQRTRNGLLVPYHLGRLTTYAGLGAVAAVTFGRLPWFNAISAVLLTIAALVFLSHALGRLMPMRDPMRLSLGKMIGSVTRRIRRGSFLGEYAFGVALGFLPCGFLYAALAAAAASGWPAMGAAAMLMFGLGTAPVLMVIGVAGQAAGRRWNRGVIAAAPVLMVLNAGLLLILAWQRVMS